MKQLKKNDLKLEKEVITSLSENDLLQVKGGFDPYTLACGATHNKEC